MTTNKKLLKEYIDILLEESSNSWTPWPSSVKRIPYKSNHAGIGPGEYRLAKILNGTVQGGSVSFDILDKQGKKWEVKEPRGGTIRAGTEGTSAFAGSRAQIEATSKRIIDGYTHAKHYLNLRNLLPIESRRMIESFIKSDIPMIMKGEIPEGRIKRLYNVLLAINSAMRESNQDTPNGADDSKYVELGDDEYNIKKNVDLSTYVHIGQELKLPNLEMHVSEGDIFAALFDYAAFKSPARWLKKTWKVPATAVFGHTSGVILVSDSGYRIVNKNRLNKEFTLYGVTQGGRPIYRV